MALRIEALVRYEVGDRQVIPLAMDAADRRRVRRRLLAPDGAEFELALATGTALPVGWVLSVDDERAYVITAAPERVLVVRPRDLAEAARVAHQIGNLHRDLEVLPDGTLIAMHDDPLHERLQRAGVNVVVEERAFHGRAPGGHAH
jgi:urease accessory protein